MVEPDERNLAIGSKITFALISFDPVSSLLGIYPEDTLAKTWKRYLQFYSLHTICNSKRLEIIHISIGSWFKKKPWYFNTMEHFTTVKANEDPIFYYCVISKICYFKKVQNSMYNYAIFYLAREEEYENVYIFTYIKRISNRRINQKLVGDENRSCAFLHVRCFVGHFGTIKCYT